MAAIRVKNTKPEMTVRSSFSVSVIGTGFMSGICLGDQIWSFQDCERLSMCAGVSGTAILAKTAREFPRPTLGIGSQRIERNVARDLENEREWKRLGWDTL